MPKMIAFCGLCCTDCPTFLATQNNDDQARAKTAELYAKKFGFDLKPEDINCDGCHSISGKLLGYCRTCAIRKCGQEKNIENCAFCDEQACEKLVDFHAFSPEAKASFKAQLKTIRKPHPY